MAAKKAAKKAVKAGETGFIAMRARYDYDRYDRAHNKKWSLASNDIHSDIEKARACCGGYGPDYAVLEVKVVAQHAVKLAFEKAPISIKFND